MRKLKCLIHGRQLKPLRNDFCGFIINPLDLIILISLIAGIALVVVGPLGKGFILLGVGLIIARVSGKSLFEMAGVKIIGSAGFVFAALGLLMEVKWF